MADFNKTSPIIPGGAAEGAGAGAEAPVGRGRRDAFAFPAKVTFIELTRDVALIDRNLHNLFKADGDNQKAIAAQLRARSDALVRLESAIPNAPTEEVIGAAKVLQGLGAKVKKGLESPQDTRITGLNPKNAARPRPPDPYVLMDTGIKEISAKLQTRLTSESAIHNLATWTSQASTPQEFVQRVKDSRAMVPPAQQKTFDLHLEASMNKLISKDKNKYIETMRTLSKSQPELSLQILKNITEEYVATLKSVEGTPPFREASMRSMLFAGCLDTFGKDWAVGILRDKDIQDMFRHANLTFARWITNYKNNNPGEKDDNAILRKLLLDKDKNDEIVNIGCEIISSLLTKMNGEMPEPLTKLLTDTQVEANELAWNDKHVLALSALLLRLVIPALTKPQEYGLEKTPLGETIFGARNFLAGMLQTVASPSGFRKDPSRLYENRALQQESITGPRNQLMQKFNPAPGAG